MPGRPLTVLKLGGSVLRGEGDLAQAVHEIYRWAREGARGGGGVGARAERPTG